MLTIHDLYRNSTRAQGSDCWLWTGGLKGCKKSPSIYTFDYAHGEKRSMSGPRAVWNIAHKAAPPLGMRPYRVCCTSLCVNPAHHRLSRGNKDVGANIKRMGVWKGKHMEARRASAKLAHKALGFVPLDPETVRQIRATPRKGDGAMDNHQLAAKFGRSHQLISQIRRGLAHRNVT